MNVAEYLIARLKQIGIEHVFAVPGDYASPFMEALDATDGIVRVPTINELGSGYAADGYARFKGAGAACVQWGVGTFSALNCAAGSFVERVPVVVISASPSTSDRVLERTQKILFHHSTGNLRADQLVYQNVTVASEVIEDAADAPARIDGALTAMLTHRRPVYIEVLKNIWTVTCADPQGSITAQPSPSNPDSLGAALDAAWSRIHEAKLPILWAGVEIQRFGLQDTLQEIVDRGRLLFTTTSLGKTVLDEAQKSFIGTYAGPASPQATQDLVNASDCLITLGAIITDDYLDIMKRSFGQMIEVNDQEVRIGYQYYHGVTLQDFVEGLLNRYRSAPEVVSTAQHSSPQAPMLDTTTGADARLTYNIFYNELAAFLREEHLLDQSALVLGESTSLYVFGNLFGLPRNSFVANAAWGSLGHETGCALGIQLASGKRPFVVAGDGGFRMVCQELSSLAYAKCTPVIFVMSNDVYAIEQAFVDLNAFKPNGSFAAFDILPKWDYLALAQAFGAQGMRVSTTGELRQALLRVKSIAGQPALIEVVIPEKDLAPQLKRLAEPPPALRKQNRN